jgi:dihydrofolate reductase
VAKLIYSAITSLDGYVADDDSNFDWAKPDEEAHTFMNDLERPVGIYLLGRRMYEVLLYWETIALADQPPYIQDFATIWQAADKIVFSKTLETASSAKTRIERAFDPDAVRRLKGSADRDLTIGGPELAAQAFEAGLVDECHVFLAPIVVRGGKQSLPGNVRLELELLDERRFGNGMVHLRYRARTGGEGEARSSPDGDNARAPEDRDGSTEERSSREQADRLDGDDRRRRDRRTGLVRVDVMLAPVKRLAPSGSLWKALHRTFPTS